MDLLTDLHEENIHQAAEEAASSALISHISKALWDLQPLFGRNCWSIPSSLMVREFLTVEINPNFTTKYILILDL